MNLFFKVVVGSLIWTLLLPLSALPISLLCVWKFLSWITLKIKWRGQHFPPESMGIVDGSFAHSDVYHFIGWAFALDGRVELKEFVTQFERTFDVGPKCKHSIFYHKVISHFGFNYKVRVKEIDLSKHIREHIVTKKESDLGLEALCLQTMKDHENILGVEVPKWEIVLLQEKTRTLIIFKMNHVLGDALSARSVLDQLFGVGWDPAKVRFPSSPSLLQKIMLFLTFPMTIVEAAKYAEGMKNYQHPYLPSNNFPEGVDKEVFLSWGKLSFLDVRDLARRTGTRVISVLITLQILALKKLLEDKKDSEKSGNNLHVVMVPSPSWDHPVLKQGRTCNHGSLAFYAVPILDEASRLEQLQATDKSVRESDSINLTPSIGVLYSLLDPLFPKCLILKTTEPQETPFIGFLNPCIFSGEEYTLLGSKVESVRFLTSLEEKFLKHRGLLLTPITRGDQIDFTVHATNDILENQSVARLYAERIQAEFTALSEEVSKA